VQAAEPAVVVDLVQELAGAAQFRSARRDDLATGCRPGRLAQR
jgi:hypothetical protein